MMPGRRCLDGPVADPGGATIAAVRDIHDIRDAVDTRINGPLARLAP
ncbi:hypothetical protein [Streptomyces nojiriensis]|nr:hypothetical protein [Streptomyces nojiriensis]